MSDAGSSASGAGLRLFARYAYPPNELGYCGGPDHAALLDYGTAQAVDRGLRQLALGFYGPLPYLTCIAGAAGAEDLYDRRVVEAYWVGNELLERADMADFGRILEQQFRGRAGALWGRLAEQIPAGAVAHHSFHVLGVYPWMGLLKAGHVDDPLSQMDRCRVRWGQVLETVVDRAVVRYRPLAWTGTDLVLGEPRVEEFTVAVDGAGFVLDLEPGDWVSMHWHWVCDRLDRRQLANLRHYSRLQLDVVNRVEHSGPGLAMADGI